MIDTKKTKRIVSISTKIALLAICFFALKAGAGQAQANQPFNCTSAMYLSQGQTDTQLNVLDMSGAQPSFTPIGATDSAGYNAMGYRFLDGYIYANRPGTDIIVRISADGSVVPLGAASGLSTPGNGLPPAASYAAADVDHSGYLHMLTFSSEGTPNPNLWAVVDVSSSTPALIDEFALTVDIPGRLSVGDIAYNPRDQKFYGINTVNNRVVVITIEENSGIYSGNLVHLPEVNTFTGTTPHGAAYINSKGQLVTVQNNPGWIYAYDIGIAPDGTITPSPTGRTQSVSRAPNTNQNDGASCPYVPHLEKIASPERVTAGDVVTYTYTIYNPIPNQVLGLTFSDVLEDGRTFVAGSLQNNYGGTVNNYADTNTIHISGMEIPAGRNASISVDVLIPEETPTGVLLNQACISDFSNVQFQEEICSDYPVTSIFGDHTPVYVTAKEFPGPPSAGSSQTGRLFGVVAAGVVGGVLILFWRFRVLAG